MSTITLATATRRHPVGLYTTTGCARVAASTVNVPTPPRAAVTLTVALVATGSTCGTCVSGAGERVTGGVGRDAPAAAGDGATSKRGSPPSASDARSLTTLRVAVTPLTMRLV